MLKKRRFWAFVVIRTLANTLIISGIIFSFIAFYPFVKQEIQYWWNTNFGPQRKVVVEAKTPKATLPPIQTKPVSTDFGIVIEKINVNAPIVAGVDASNYKEYIAALAKGVAHAKGTAVPGSTKEANNNVFLFAHSALNPIAVQRYNAVFYLLRKLEPGDRIVTFYKGKRYDYIVFDKKVVQASDIRYLTEPSLEPIITLQTCDPPGSSLRRLIITGKLVLL